MGRTGKTQGAETSQNLQARHCRTKVSMPPKPQRDDLDADGADTRPGQEHNEDSEGQVLGAHAVRARDTGERVVASIP